MKVTHSLSLICLLVMMAFGSASAQPDLQKPFEDCGFEGSITVFDYKKGTWITSDSTDSRLKTVPASTFKIPNLLIALEAGVIGSEMDTVGWIGSIDTTLYGYRPSTYKDMTVRHAFEVSAGWVFMELAKKVGRQRYEQVLRDIGYGNATVPDNADFWNFGPLKVSPRDQVELLVNGYEETLPFSKSNLDILKEVMVTERTEAYTIRSKTGWGVQDGKDIGWWVGYVERKDNVYFFATRISKTNGTPSADFLKCRLDITKAVLRQLGAL